MPWVSLCFALTLGATAAPAAPIDAKDSPDQAVDRLTAAINDPSATPAQRAQAVQALGVVLGTTERIVTFSPNTEHTLTFFTFGASEVVFGLLLRKSVVPDARLPGISQTLGQAFCDAAPEVHGAARLVIDDADHRVAAPALARALSCPTAARAEAALPALEVLLHAASETIQGRGKLTLDVGSYPEVEATWPALEATTQHGAEGLPAKATATLTKATSELDHAFQSIVTEAHDPDALTVTDEELKSPLWRPFLNHTIPALQARLRDSSIRIRRTAASSIWALQDRAPAALDELVAHFWQDWRFPGVLSADQKELLDRGIKEGVPGGDCMTLHNAILELGPLASDAVPFMRQHLAALHKNNGEVFMDGELFALATIGPAAAVAAPEIAPALKSWFPSVKLAGASALALTAHDPKGLPTLHEELRHPSTMELDTVVAALAALAVAPDDKLARKYLALDAGPLSAALARRAITKPAPGLDPLLPLFSPAGAAP